MAAIFQIRRGTTDISSSIVDGELYLHKGKNSLQVAIGDGNPITLLALNTSSVGNINLTGNITASNAYFSGDVAISGNLFLGNQTSDTITATGEFTSNLIPNPTDTYNLGSDTKRWGRMFVNSVSASAFTGSLYGMGDPTSFSTSVDLRLDRMEASASLYDNAMSGSNRLYVSPSGSDSYDGKDPSTPFRTIKAAVESLGSAIASNIQRTTIFVGSGNYTENNPIAVPPGVAIVGDTLRTVRLTASNPTKDYFHCHDSNYFYGLRFLDLKHPAFAFSYPCSTAIGTISAGGVSGLTLIHTESGYVNGESVNVIIEGPDASGSVATATATVSGGTLSINMVSNGSGYAAGEKPHISIQAPTSKRPVIGTSPYIQNCSSITGPITTDGVALSLNPASANYAPLPYNINDVRNASNAVIGSGIIDEQGAGGGIRIDGNLVSGSSPLESFVADAFTQVNQGGPGHLVINKGYAQFVSCFTTFCTYGFKVANGGFANISNSVIDFGAKGLVSKTYFPQTYNTGSSLQTLTSTVVGAVIDQDGAGYTGSVATVTITGGGGSGATAEATVNANGSIDEIVILTPGSGYTSQPTLTIAAPTGINGITASAEASKAEISGIAAILFQLESGSRGVDVSSNMILSGSNYLVTNVATGSSANERYVTVYPAPPSITTGNNVYFHQLSNISTGGLVMEYVGSGITYNALPKFGGVPNRTKEIVEYAPGRVFYSTVDNIGNLKIGDFFAVNQLTGEVTIDANQFNLSGLSAIGPFKRNGVGVGVILNEVSNNTTLLNAQGITGEDTVPTQYAVKGYIDIRDGRLNNLETTSASVNTSVASLNTYTASLKTAIDVTGGNTRIIGNLIVDGTQTSLNTSETFIEDKSITLASGSTSSGIADGAGFNIAGANVSMSWEDSNQRLYFNTNIATLGSISSSTIIGLNGVSVTTYSTSVDSRLSNLQSKSASVDISISTLNTFTSSNENTSLNLYTASANTWSGTIDTRFTTLGTYTASVNQTTSSLNEFSASVISSLISIYQTTSSLNQTTTSLNSFSGNVNTRFDNLQTYTTSVDSRFGTLGTYTGSINQHTASLNTFTASVSQSIRNLNIFSSSYYIDSASFDYRITILDPGNLDNVLLGLNAFTQSANVRFTEIGIVTGSLINSASNASTRLDALETETSNLELYTQSVENRFTNLASYTGSVNTTITSLNSFTQSANVRLNNIESFTSSINTTIKTKLDSDGVISGSLQILGNSTIHSGSIGNYQFNSIGVGTEASIVAGEIRATGDIVAFYSSDERLKENIQPIENALTKVEAISGNTYDWKKGFETIHSNKGRDVGVIAQELEKILPEVVTERETGYKAVNYEKIVPLLIEAIKELSAKIKELENK